MSTFEEKVKAMTGREIVLAMVESLKHPVVRVDMDTYGSVNDGVCYGCAATNTICRISRHTFTPQEIRDEEDRAKALGVDCTFLWDFECAIDELRRGCINYYNDYAEGIGIAMLKVPKYVLPKLTTENYHEHLDTYRKFAEEQDQ